MKIEEFEEKFNNIIKNPDSGISDAPEFLEQVRADYETSRNLGEKVSELEGRVKDLQEANIKLYLATTGEIEEEEDDLTEDDGEEYIDAVFNKLVEEESEV